MGKHKQHHNKIQVVINQTTRQIMRTSFCRGSHHDFHLFKQTRLPIPSGRVILADLVYLGIGTIHSLACIPFKSSKLQKITCQQKSANQQQRKLRITIEYLFSL